MAYPPPVSDDEKKMLRLLKARTLSNPIERSRYEIAAGLPPSIFGDGIAHLVAGGLIDTAEARQGFLKTIFGKEPDISVFITPSGLNYLEHAGHTTAAEDVREAALRETPEDRRNTIEEAVRVFDDSFSQNPIYPPKKIAEASARLDDDVKAEIKRAALEREAMWCPYETKFGHRGPASSEAEANFRDPVIKMTTVRIIRAMDEQLRRLNLPMSRKPRAWATHYNDGHEGLEPASWET